ncbi:MAG: hypothetical protein P8125_13550 [Gemmatimonadota bacterium]
MDMREIQVDEEVWQYLQERAVPLVDTPNSVLRRLLFGKRRGKKPPGEARSALRSEARLMRMESPVELAVAPTGPYRSMRGERTAPGGLSPRRMGRRLVAREFAGEHFDRAAKERGGFRTMFESTKRLVYFLNFNKPDSRNMLFRVTASAIEALTTAAKPAYVIFSNPARRIAWVIPVEDMLARYEEVFGAKFEPQDLVLNIDIERDLLRELNWDISEYRREVENPNGGE